VGKLAAVLASLILASVQQSGFASAPDIHFLTTDPGVKWTVDQEECHLIGTTQNKGKTKAHFDMPVAADGETRTEISCAFCLGNSTFPKMTDGVVVSVGVRTDNPNAGPWPALLYFHGTPSGGGSYSIQSQQLKLHYSLASGAMSRAQFGDEGKAFHTMTITLDRQHSEAKFCVDSVALGTLKVDGDLGAIRNIGVDVEAPDQGSFLDVHIKYPQMSHTAPGFAGAADMHFVTTDPGVKWIVDKEECHLIGTTQTKALTKARFDMPIAADVGSRTQICCAFWLGNSTLPKLTRGILVSVGAQTDNPNAGQWPLLVRFRGTPWGGGSYGIEPEQLKLNYSLASGAMFLAQFGDEGKVFHIMTITLDRQRSEVEFSVDKVAIGTLDVDDDLGAIRNIGVEVEAPDQGSFLDVHIMYPQMGHPAPGATIQVLPNPPPSLPPPSAQGSTIAPGANQAGTQLPKTGAAGPLPKTAGSSNRK
jgi:hypothetical protein